MPHPHRMHPAQHPPPSQPTAFNALSSIAIDELHALERQEVLRRAEYEARHAEALRRVESENRFQLEASNPYFRHRLSRSATTSPTATPALRPGHVPHHTPGEQRYSGLSSERDGHSIYSDKESQRRLSTPWYHTPPSSYRSNLVQSRSSGHLVDQIRPAGASHGVHHYAASSHPYHPQPPHAHYRRLAANVHEDSPSPISSDSDTAAINSRSPSQMLLQVNPPSNMHSRPHSSDWSPSYYSSTMRTTDMAYTPSTSPFLGPLQTLNIHSADPSRAPSPVLLPPPTIESHDRDRDMVANDGRPEGPSVAGSPTNSSVLIHQHRNPLVKQTSKRRDSLGYAMPPSFHQSQPHHHQYLASPSGAPTPQLSSGPSSSGSSPGGLGQHTPLGPPPILPPGAGLVSSTTSSRAPSPVSWTSGLAAGQMTAIANAFQSGKREHNHSNLAHSVRVAFGMTPIVPSSPKSHAQSLSGGSRSHSLTSLTASMHSLSSHSLSTNLWDLRSMPGSRSGSPPITLPPLKVPRGVGDDEDIVDGGNEGEDGARIKKEDDDDVLIDGVDKKASGKVRKSERVELPGFSQFEAVARGLPPAASVSGLQKMSIDFMR